MKRGQATNTIIIASLLVVIGLFSFLLKQPIGPGLTGITGLPIATSSSCGDVVDSLTLTANVNISGGGACFTINASNIVLDCAGFNVSCLGVGCPGGTGIIANSTFSGLNITIKNCNFFNLSTGINANDIAQDIVVFNNSFLASTNGISLTTLATSGNISNNVISVSTSGIRLTQTASNFTIENNRFVGGNRIVRIEGSDSNKILRNSFNNTLVAVFDFTEPTPGQQPNKNNVSFNTFYNISGVSVRMDKTRNNTFINNLFLNNLNVSIEITNSTLIVLDNNTFVDTALPHINSTDSESVNNTLIFRRGKGILEFRRKMINVTNSSNFFLNNSIVSVNTAVEAAMNTSANITMEVATCPTTIRFNPNFTTDVATARSGAQVCNAGTTPACTAISCIDSTTLFFNVQQFSTYVADACLSPVNGENISSSTTLCNGTFNLPDGIRINASNIVLTCNGTTLNGSGVAGLIGINITNVDNATIRSCAVSNFDTGILISNSSRNNISDGNITQGSSGISLSTSLFNIINNNTFTGQGISGISTTSTNHTRISGNRITTSDTGIGVQLASNNNTILLNTMQGMTTNAILISSSFSNTVSNNTILPETSTGVGIDLVSSNNTYVFINNISGSSVGISITSSSINNTILSNLISNGSVSSATGILISVSISTSIINNTITGGRSFGISLSNSNQTLIINNSIINGGTGIRLITSSNRNTIANNTIFNNSVHGITIATINNSVTSNIIMSNNQSGILLLGAINNSISSNNITFNRLQGLLLTFSNGSTISNNFIFNNTESGILLNRSFNNIISNNTFVNNTPLDIFTSNVSNNTLVILRNQNMLTYANKFINVTDIDNLFINSSIVAVNSSAEPQMNVSANVSFSVVSCSAQLFTSSGFFTTKESALQGATNCTTCSDMVCSNNVMNFTTSSFSTISANYVPNITTIFPNATNQFQNISTDDTNVTINISSGTNQTFNLTVEDLDSSFLTFRWFVDGVQFLVEVVQGIANLFTSAFRFVFSDLGQQHNITVVVNDSVRNDTFTFGTTTVCKNPADGLMINYSTNLCPGTFNLVNGLVINSQNVVLTCDGTIINGSSLGVGRGISINASSNITIKGCTIQNYRIGFNGTVGVSNSSFSNNVFININDSIFLDISSSMSNNFTNNTMMNVTSTGIRVCGSGNNSYSLNNISGTGTVGIDDECASSSNNKYLNNVVLGSNISIQQTGSASHNVSFIGNALSSGSIAIELSPGGGDHLLINNNVFVNFSTSGISRSAGSTINVSLINNTFTNVSRAISLSTAGVNNATIENNTIMNSSIFAISHIGTGSQQVHFIKNNFIRCASGDGFVTSGSAVVNATFMVNTILSCRVAMNISNGGMSSSLIQNNNFTGSTLRAISFESSTADSNIIKNNTFASNAGDIFSISDANNTLILLKDSNTLLFDNKVINVTSISSNLFINSSVAAVNSSAEPQMNVSANVSFSVVSCSAQLFTSSGFFTTKEAALQGATNCTTCSDMVCSNNVMNFTTSSFSTISANYVPNITTIFPNATNQTQGINTQDNNVTLNSSRVGTNLTFNVTVEDIDSSFLTFRWFVDGIERFVETVTAFVGNLFRSVFSFVFNASGVHNITVVVNDSASNDTFTFYSNFTCVDNDFDGFNLSVVNNVNVSGCGTVFDCNDNDANIIPPSRNYIINRSISFCSGFFSLSNGVEINASNVVVTCNSTTLNGTGSSDEAITVIGDNNVTIQNCTIIGFNEGILLAPSNGSFIFSNNISNPGFAGIDLSLNSNNNTIKDNLISNSSSEGILITGGRNNNVTNNTLLQNVDGVRLQSSTSNNTISSNNITNSVEGISFDTSSVNANVISNNFILNSSSKGISLRFGAGNMVSNNTLVNNAADIFTQGTGTTNVLIVLRNQNILRFTDQVINVTDIDNLFINSSIVAVNSSAEPQMNVSANVSFSVGSCAAQLFKSPLFATNIVSAQVNATDCTSCSGIVCSNNVMNFTTADFSTITASNAPNIVTVFPNASNEFQNISTDDNNVSSGSFVVGTNKNFNVTATDLDSTTLTFGWYVDSSLGFTEALSVFTSNFSTTFNTVGDHNVTVIVNDSLSNDTFRFEINIFAAPSAAAGGGAAAGGRDTFAPCAGNFECGPWSACINGEQERTCEDLQGCYKPKTEKQSCVVAVVEEKPTVPTGEVVGPEIKPPSARRGAFIATLAFMVLLFIVITASLIEKLRSPAFVYRREFDVKATKDIISKTKEALSKDRKLAVRLYNDAVMAYKPMSDVKKKLFEKDLKELHRALAPSEAYVGEEVAVKKGNAIAEKAPASIMDYDVQTTLNIINKAEQALSKNKEMARHLYADAQRAYTLLSKGKKVLVKEQLEALKKKLI